MDVEVNRPEVVAEVLALFEQYEQALISGDVAVLDACFWDSPHTVRLAVKENCYGFAAIHAARVAMAPGGSKEKRVRLEVLTLGRDLATVNLEYLARPSGRTGRQSQTWVRFPEVGWRVVSAHVSLMD